MRLCEKFIIVRSPRWWWELPGGSECSLVTVKAPRWWRVLPGGSEVSQVAVRAPWWQWVLPGGGECSLMVLRAPTQLHGHAESETAVLFCVCNVFCSYGRKHHGFTTKNTPPLHFLLSFPICKCRTHIFGIYCVRQAATSIWLLCEFHFTFNMVKLWTARNYHKIHFLWELWWIYVRFVYLFYIPIYLRFIKISNRCEWGKFSRSWYRDFIVYIMIHRVWSWAGLGLILSCSWRDHRDGSPSFIFYCSVGVRPTRP